VGPGGVFLEGGVGSRGMDMILSNVKIKLLDNRNVETIRRTGTYYAIFTNKSLIWIVRGALLYYRL
jgi:hypothetical protein